MPYIYILLISQNNSAHLSPVVTVCLVSTVDTRKGRSEVQKHKKKNKKKHVQRLETGGTV